MRPQYETEKDLAREGEVREMVAHKLGCNIVKLPKSYVIDAAAIRDGKMQAFLEVKCRNNPSTQYPTYMVALKKVQAAKSLYDVSGLRTYIFVQFTDLDAPLFTRLNDQDYSIGMGGRTDRNDPADIEPCVFISMMRFSRWRAIGEG